MNSNIKIIDIRTGDVVAVVMVRDGVDIYGEPACNIDIDIDTDNYDYEYECVDPDVVMDKLRRN